MASFWIEYPAASGLVATKLVGGMAARRAQREFPRFVADETRKRKGTVDWKTAHHAIVTAPTGDKVCFSLELFSPPSAPEPYQPKRLDGGVPLIKGEALPKGILIDNRGAHDVGVATSEGDIK